MIKKNEAKKKVDDEVDKKKSNEAEGFVLNIDGYKVKVKYDDYVRMHRLLSVLLITIWNLLAGRKKRLMPDTNAFLVKKNTVGLWIFMNVIKCEKTNWKKNRRDK